MHLIEIVSIYKETYETLSLRRIRLQLSQDFVPLLTTATLKWCMTTYLNMMGLSFHIFKMQMIAQPHVGVQ